jgi:hypothetical protein
MTSLEPQRQKCSLCNNLERRLSPALVTELQRRLAFDFTIEELSGAATGCGYCRLILKGLEAFAVEIGDLRSSISRVYACGPSEGKFRTLTLELYFQDDSRRKLLLEIYTLSETSELNASSRT